MGWGEEHGRSAEMVRHAETLRRADELALALERFAEEAYLCGCCQQSSMKRRLREVREAVEAYNEVRRGE